MARSRPSTGDQPSPESTPETPSTGEPPVLREVEWNPDAPRRSSARARAEAVAAASPFRASIPDGLYRAHENLMAQLGGPPTLIRAQGLSLRRDRPGLENIEAVYIGKKRVNGHLTGQFCVKVHVRFKANELSQVQPDAQIPPVIEIAGKQYLTDIEPIDDVVALQGYGQLEKPARGGCSIGLDTNYLGVTGTFGALVVLDDGSLCILTNNHVAADLNNAPIGTQVLQPGLADADNGDPGNTYIIGKLYRVVPLNLTSNPTAAGVSACTVDAVGVITKRAVALASYHTFDELNPDPLGGDPQQRDLYGLPVKKEGRTTGYTEGQITGINAYVPVQYTRSDGANLYGYFTNQLVIEGSNEPAQPFSDHGDSGSLIVHQTTNQPIGLLYSGGTYQQTGRRATFANPILDVMDQLGIDHFAPLNPPTS